MNHTMWSLKKIALGILFLVLWAGSLEAVQITTYANEWHMENNASFSKGYNIVHDDDAFLYMICANKKFPSQVNCSVILETATFGRSPLKTTCTVNIVPKEGRELVSFSHELPANLEHIGKSRAVLFWIEVEKINKRRHSIFEILNLTDCSRVHLLESNDIDTDRLIRNIIIYPHGFDLVVLNQLVCRDLITCRVSFDVEGQRIGEPVAFNVSLNDALANPVSPSSDDKGFCLYGLTLPDWKLGAEHVSAVGLRTHLITVNISETQLTIMEFSSAHETCGICWTTSDDKVVECAQFDTNGKEKMRTNFEFDEPVKALVVYNLADDGMLVGSLNYDEDEHKARGFDVAKIRPDGGKDEVVMKVTGLDLKYDHLREVPVGLLTGVSENPEQYCFYFTCSTKPTGQEASSVAKYVRQCIGKEKVVTP